MLQPVELQKTKRKTTPIPLPKPEVCALLLGAPLALEGFLRETTKNNRKNPQATRLQGELVLAPSCHKKRQNQKAFQNVRLLNRGGRPMRASAKVSMWLGASEVRVTRALDLSLIFFLHFFSARKPLGLDTPQNAQRFRHTRKQKRLGFRV